ncbi:ADP-forming succinate--CoA ligase subunit beta [Abyssibacter sp.]|jgi:succinyl-CoA synthetase beta subunit|uniref:ADP-forming succinate--CoA ligase subunit beta n=1 Tax=Abyssibacter sp. TaxID=2320200 RepID=UPI0025BB609B|nr:ADP-forming succinate--CoA ligase subunit beta [Abyssibacter sp.]MCK5859467.1 ADP-forming succinate--CoA ligase subunit beta [Abyssibacter sp.]
MNLHEYQAKGLFAEYGIPVPTGHVASSPDEAVEAAKKLGGERWVVKAQVHTGGRGKVGGVKLVDTLDEVKSAAAGMLGQRLVTKQTDAKGLPINLVLVEEPSAIVTELYLSVLVDRGTDRIVVMASPEGGMDIEEVAENTPEKILAVGVPPGAGFSGYQARRLGFFLGLNKDQIGQFGKIVNGFIRLFHERDASLVEINPLIIKEDGSLAALDAKLNFDDNALYRNQDIAAMADPTQEDEKELAAAKHDLNYVTLEGDIGCMVNGAGLAMATMDIIKLHGGQPANFLDVGGGATAERVTEAFKLITSGSDVKAILVNIFGGIVRCDLIAEGIIEAVKQVGLTIPVIARLEGTNVEQGRKLLEESDFDIIPAVDLTDAAKKVVEAAK